MRSSIAAITALLASTLSTCGHEEPAVVDARHRQDPSPAADAAPRARLRLSGHLEGRLEPCGCASGQVGGLARRSFRLQQDRTSYDFLIEGGNLTVDGSPLDELRLYTMLNVLDDQRVRYDAVGVGPGDLRLPTELLAGYVESFPKLPFTVADLVPKGDADDAPTWPFVPFVDLTAEGVKVRVTGFACAAPAKELTGAFELELLEPAAAWERAMEGVPADTLRVLLYHGSTATAAVAAELEPRPDLVVLVNAEHAEPMHEPESIEGVPFVHPGIRGRFLVDVTLARIDGTPRVTRYSAFPLEGSRTAKGALEDDDVKALILAHRFEVKEDGTREKMAERLPTPTGASYVGTQQCMGCHFEAHKVWKDTKHAHAWQTLADAEASGRYPWPVTHYPDCIECHTVGYGQVSGFVNPEKTPNLAGVGCESCHGPAGEHVKNPTENKMPDVGPESCRQCHDFEQSPDFDYAERWKKIEHK